MYIVVFGASGKVGAKVVKLLLENDHSVKAFVHGISPLVEHSNLEIIYGDIKDQSEVYDAITDTDAVISTLGSWGTKTKDILTSGMLSIIPAMEDQNVNRIISLTGAGAFVENEKRNFIDIVSRFVMGHIAGKVLEDGEHHIKLLQNTQLDWSVLRSPVMKEEHTDNKAYKLTTVAPLPWRTIPRDHVAQAMVDLLDSKDYSQQSPFISRK